LIDNINTVFFGGFFVTVNWKTFSLPSTDKPVDFNRSACDATLDDDAEAAVGRNPAAGGGQEFLPREITLE
jgi:hypothetical protein